MATANQASESTISGKALDLLECFVSGLDEKILELAELVAKRRQGHAAAIAIEAQDVEEAADLLFGQIKERLGAQSSTAEPLKMIEDMHRCLKDKCRTQMQDKPR